MEFGVFVQTHVPEQVAQHDRAGIEHKRLIADVDAVVAADRNNWKYAWVTEHHFLDEYSHLSANEVFLGWVGALTERIHVGSGIFNITPPVNHPIRIAERVMMLDHLTDHRFEFGSGRGSSTTEQGGFGITDPELTRDMWDEALPEIIRMWKDEDYSFEGQFFSSPSRKVLPRQHGPTHPPLWVAAGNPGTFEKAAQLGLGVLCFSHAAPQKLEAGIELYKKTIENAEPIGDYVNNNIACVSTMLCREDRNEALDMAANMGPNYLLSNVFRYLDTFPKPDWVPDWPATIPEPTRDIIEMAVDKGLFIVGDPDDCKRGVQVFEDIGADQLILSPTATQLESSIAIETIEYFGQEVIPHFDKDEVHSTTRYRQAYENSGIPA